ncbi:MAG: LysR family transcriptional regulator [Nitratireductor sp.]|nr:LysR family transcriptional regulator [Nitratireductor sp.]
MDTLTRMQAFIEVVDAEGFSAAARKLGRSKALMSKYVRELEDDLGILLLNRTTRQFSLTEAGQQYYDQASDILRRIGDLQESVRETGSGLRGRLRVSAPRSLTDLEIGLPIVEFAAEYPDITLELNLDDRIVDLVEDGYDVAIRISRLTDSTLIAKKLADFRLVICASPQFIEKHGRPEKPRDLLGFPAIVDTNWKGRNNWLLVDDDGREVTVTVDSPFEVNSPEVAKRAALAGLGITMAPYFSVEREIKNGSLVSLLENRIPTGSGVYAVYPHRRHVPAKVRVFVDFMARWFRDNGIS